jgi:NAD(P)-dependent dehydrogenase (short-subunit alcohol dehydrogenase family)
MTPTQTALITGASRGLGLALARELAARGWTLILDARNAADLETVRAELTPKTQVITIAGDVANTQHRAELVEAVRSVGGLNALVNNASTLGTSPRPNLLDYDLTALEEVYRVNVIAPLALLQAVYPHLKPNARILNVTSDAGLEAYAGWGGYGSSKAALEHLTRIFAAEQPELRVYHVDPGDMQTQMHQEAFPGEDISDRPSPEAAIPGFIKLLEGDLPSGRYQAQKLGQPQPEQGVRSVRVALTTHDLDAALTFYRDQLGLPVLAQWDNPPGRGFVLDAGRGEIELLDEPQAEQVDQIEAGKRVSGGVRLAFEVENVDDKATAFAPDERVAATVVTPWGDRNARLHAPDDLQVTLYQVIPEPVSE